MVIVLASTSKSPQHGWKDSRLEACVQPGVVLGNSVLQREN